MQIDHDLHGDADLRSEELQRVTVREQRAAEVGREAADQRRRSAAQRYRLSGQARSCGTVACEPPAACADGAWGARKGTLTCQIDLIWRRPWPRSAGRRRAGGYARGMFVSCELEVLGGEAPGQFAGAPPLVVPDQPTAAGTSAGRLAGTRPMRAGGPKSRTCSRSAAVSGPPPAGARPGKVWPNGSHISAASPSSSPGSDACHHRARKPATIPQPTILVVLATRDRPASGSGRGTCGLSWAGRADVIGTGDGAHGRES